MKLNAVIETEVLVMGAGLAGMAAAITAAEAGARVCITSSTKLCSGSSFYPGTWGLGLIGPENPEDEQDLIDTIMRVGEQMADRELVETMVSGIPSGIQYLKSMGLHLKEAVDKDAKEFIPCFDYKNRNWNGLIQQEARNVFLKRLEELDVEMMPDTEIIQLVKKDGSVQGAIALRGEEILFLAAGSVVIASGGMGGIFEYRLNTSDITGMGQYLALEAGAKLVNLEFFQMMPGYVKPAPKTIYNEKVFRYSLFRSMDTGRSVFEGMDEKEVKEALEQHSFHGPYTTRLKSRIIDEAIFRAFLKDKRGVMVSYKEELETNQSEFIKTYFDWLWEHKVLTKRDTIWIGIYAHASNGGIKIDAKAKTGVPGLFACGEATGGMHGADRLGGLSTANGLVFGRIAGEEAASHAKQIKPVTETEVIIPVVLNAKHYLEEIQAINTKASMIERNKAEAEQSLEKLLQIEREIKEKSFETSAKTTNYQEIADSGYLFAALVLTRCLLHAILLREESRGSHNRTDFPRLNSEMNHVIVSSKEKENIDTKFYIGH